MNSGKRYHGWWVVFCAFVIALYGWGLGFYGLSLCLVALQKAHGWSPATISSAISFYYIAGAFLVMQVGDVIQKRGARLVVIAGASSSSSRVMARTRCNCSDDSSRRASRKVTGLACGYDMPNNEVLDSSARIVDPL